MSPRTLTKSGFMLREKQTIVLCGLQLLEEKSGSTSSEPSFLSFQYYQSFFDVTTSQVQSPATTLGPQ